MYTYICMTGWLVLVCHCLLSLSAVPPTFILIPASTSTLRATNGFLAQRCPDFQ